MFISSCFKKFSVPDRDHSPDSADCTEMLCNDHSFQKYALPVRRGDIPSNICKARNFCLCFPWTQSHLQQDSPEIRRFRGEIPLNSGCVRKAAATLPPDWQVLHIPAAVKSIALASFATAAVTRFPDRAGLTHDWCSNRNFNPFAWALALNRSKCSKTENSVLLMDIRLAHLIPNNDGAIKYASFCSNFTHSETDMQPLLFLFLWTADLRRQIVSFN
mgnify:CR=1 FL=1